MKNTYNNVIPAALGTKVSVQRAPGDLSRDHPVVAWASVNGGPLEALIDVNKSGVLTPISELRQTTEMVFTRHPHPFDFGQQ